MTQVTEGSSSFLTEKHAFSFYVFSEEKSTFFPPHSNSQYKFFELTFRILPQNIYRYIL
jgi:hypothetical protein